MKFAPRRNRPQAPGSNQYQRHPAPQPAPATPDSRLLSQATQTAQAEQAHTGQLMRSGHLARVLQSAKPDITPAELRQLAADAAPQ